MKKLIVISLILLACSLSHAQVNPGLGVASQFSILTNGNISLPNFINANGKVAGTLLNASNLNASGGDYLPSDALSQQAFGDLNNFINYCSGLTGSSLFSPIVNASLTPGVYSFNGTLSLSDTISLSGDTNSVFIFNIDGNLNVSTGCLLLLNNVNPQNIFWVLANPSSTATINEDVSFSGILINKGGSSLKTRNSGYLSVLSSANSNISIENNNPNNLTYLFSNDEMYNEQHRNYPSVVKCFFDEIKRKVALINSSFQKNANDAEDAIHNIISNNLMLSPATNQYVIPVVVHIVHDPADVNPGTGSNITDAQVLNQISELNDYFANTAGNPPPAQNMNIRFCLATKDPNGGAITGISRHPSTLTNTDVSPAGQAALKGLGYYTSSNYLNIWIVSSITNGNPNYQITGYATFPYMLPATSDGIVVRYDYFGNYNTCASCNLNTSSEGKILVHEAGHYLDIFHTFEGGCSGMSSTDCNLLGDKCCDTPPVAISNFGCAINNSCNEVPNNPDQIENHMDYSSESCHYVFTSDQRDRVHATLSSYRSYLVSAPNLFSTGVGCTGGIIANFTASPIQLCINNSVTFNSLYLSATATYNWDFGDGTSVGIGNPITHQYTSAGNFDVTLTVIDNSNSVSYIQPHYIFVNSCNPIQSEKGNWYFGYRCALSFSSGAPIAITNSPMGAPSPEASMSPSDQNGNLLFFSNGVNVWDPAYTLLPVTLSGGTSSAQCLPVPNPGNNNEYYLFYHYDYGSIPAYYSILNINNYTFPSLNVPMGLPYHSEAVTAIPHCNGNDYWIIYHTSSAAPSNSYYVYLLSSSGLSAPSIYPSSANFSVNQGLGCFDASPDGSHLALSFHNSVTTNALEIVDFDKTTGVISNPVVLPYASYATSFSPNSRFLYLARDQGSATSRYIIQLDLLNNFQASNVSLAGSFNNLQAGPDNKIYISKYAPSQGAGRYLAVINYPDILNTNVSNNECGFNTNATDLDPTGLGHYPHFSLPNFIDAQKPSAIIPDFTWTVSNCYDYTFTATQCGTTYSWNFNDGSNTVTGNPVTHSFPQVTGSYNVVLTINGSITVNHQINIGIQTAPVIFGPLCISNLNQLYNYSVNSQPGLVYDWTISGGTPATLQNSTNIDVTWLTLSGGTVTVTATDPLTGCTASASIVVSSGSSLDVPLIAGGDLSGCNGQSTYNISNASAYSPTCTFSWTAVPNNIAFTPIVTANGSSALVDWNGSKDGGWIYVSVNCGSCTSPQGSYYVQPCCEGTGTPATIVYGDIKASQLPNPFTMGNTEVVFNGVVTIDVPSFAIQSSTNIRFGPGAKIYNKDNELIIKDVYMYEGCGEMWNGIILKGKAKFTAQTWSVEDAQYAVFADDNTYATIRGCTFNKNYAGIYVPPSPLGFSNVTLNLSDLHFDCSLSGTQTNLLPPFVTQSPTPGSISYSGILINDMASFNLTVGYNTFNNLNMGITSYASNVLIKGLNIFTNIHRDFFYGNFYDGSGVAALGGHGIFSISHYGFAPTVQNPWGFNNCRFGIYTERMNTTVQNNYMNNMNRGVVVFRSFTSNISSNTINCLIRGIDLQYNDGATSMSVSNNTINVGPGILTTNPSRAIGINVVEVNAAYAANHLSIFENYIHVYNGLSGIVIRNSARPSIGYNLVYLYNTPVNFSGISISGSDNSYVSCNSVTGSSFTLPNQRAYNISITPNSHFLCNVSDNTYYAWEIDGVCATANGFAGNFIKNHFTGLRLGTSVSVLDFQSHRGNIWLNTTNYPGWGAENLGFFPSFYPFTVNQNANAQFLPDFTPPLWFLPTGTGTAFDCSTSQICLAFITPPDDGELGAIDYYIADDTITVPQYQPETNWMAEKYLFEKLQNDTSLLSDSIMAIFYNQKQNTNLGSLADIKKQMQKSSDINVSIKNLLSSNRQLLDDYFESLRLNDSLINNGSPDSLLLIEQNNDLRQYIKNITLQNNTLITLAEQNSDVLMNAAKLQNNSINSSALIEQNEKIVTSIYMETIYKGIYTFTVAQADALLTVAQQCPFAGGSAVYKARGMYELINEEMDYDDLNVCFQNGILIRKANTENTTVSTFKAQIIPNPSSDKVKLIYTLPDDTGGSFIISNSIGQQIVQYNLSSSSHELSFTTEKLSSGVYFYKVLARSNLIDNGKLIIIK